MNPKLKNEKPKDIEFLYKDTVNVFTDLIQINITNETVSMELAIRNKDNKSAVVSHNVIMTLPHFIRFVQVSNGLSENILKKINEIKE